VAEISQLHDRDERGRATRAAPPSLFRLSAANDNVPPTRLRLRRMAIATAIATALVVLSLKIAGF